MNLVCFSANLTHKPVPLYQVCLACSDKGQVNEECLPFMVQILYSSWLKRPWFPNAKIDVSSCIKATLYCKKNNTIYILIILNIVWFILGCCSSLFSWSDVWLWLDYKLLRDHLDSLWLVYKCTLISFCTVFLKFKKKMYLYICWKRLGTLLKKAGISQVRTPVYKKYYLNYCLIRLLCFFIIGKLNMKTLYL